MSEKKEKIMMIVVKEDIVAIDSELNFKETSKAFKAFAMYFFNKAAKNDTGEFKDIPVSERLEGVSEFLQSLIDTARQDIVGLYDK